MSDIKPELKQLYNDVYKSVSEASRVTDNEKPFVDQFEQEDINSIPVISERDNQIFNRGVIAGSTNLLDHLSSAGYTITAPNNEAISPLEVDDKHITFSAGYFMEGWFEVNT